MAMNLAPKVKDVLQRVVDRSDGLDYAVFLARDPQDEKAPPRLPQREECGVNRALQSVLDRYGLGHKPEEQLAAWDGVLPRIHASFLALEVSRKASAQGGPVRATCLVLDIDMGGLLYAAVGELGWVFAATLHQEAMNNGRAERELVEIVRDITQLLKPA
jgi:hypothetical protein